MAPRGLPGALGRHDLGNYFVPREHEEALFGLALNARALQESLRVLTPTGSVILNLAGRPGAEVVERVLREDLLRRGQQRLEEGDINLATFQQLAGQRDRTS